MKILLLLFTMFLAHLAKAENTGMIACPAGTLRVYYQSYGYNCTPSYQVAEANAISCSLPVSSYPGDSVYSTFSTSFYQSLSQPWWVQQGNSMFSNLQYPGAWSNSAVNSSYYPGQGQVYALKPNIYVESIHDEKKFTFTFTRPEKELSFLAVTPALENNSWKGKVLKDRFDVDDVFYDYLFYDIRLPKEKMQFESGMCASRADLIQWMLKDLKEMSYPSIALQDFEEMVTAKTPDYPFYCVYPQYNTQLDEALPVSISVPHSNFIRSLYVLVPHKTAPDASEPQTIPLPLSSSETNRPNTLVKHEVMFKEWGVAFLGD